MRSHHHPTSAPLTDLHVCRSCERPFVVPEQIIEVLPDRRYRVELRCNDCQHSSVGTFDEDTMEQLDRELDRSQAEIAEALVVAEETRMLEEIDLFVAALHADLILPEDF
jgi:hypothetical protein